MGPLNDAERQRLADFELLLRHMQRSDVGSCFVENREEGTGWWLCGSDESSDDIFVQAGDDGLPELTPEIRERIRVASEKRQEPTP